MIKSLGHVIHLLQDTGQPQHVRSDAHAPPFVTQDANDEGQADAAIEAFTDYRLLGRLRQRDRAGGSGQPDSVFR